MPSVSVIVPVRNEASSIERTLRVLLTQDFPREQFEVIVADGASTDETVPIVRRLQDEFPNLKLVFNPGRFSSAGRNIAIRHATKDVAVIVDGHCHIPDRNYLKNLAGRVRRERGRQPRPAAAARRAGPDAVPARRRRRRGAAVSATTPAPTSTPISRSSSRRRARRSRTRGASSTASASSTRRSTPARMSSSTSASTRPG